MVAEILISPVPSKLAVPTTSPAIAIFLAFARAVAVSALPVTAPVRSEVIMFAEKSPLPSSTTALLAVPSLAKVVVSVRSTLRLCAIPSPDVAPELAIPLPPVIVAV